MGTNTSGKWGRISLPESLLLKIQLTWMGGDLQKTHVPRPCPGSLKQNIRDGYWESTFRASLMAVHRTQCENQTIGI